MDARPKSLSKNPLPDQNTPPPRNPRTLSYNGEEESNRAATFGRRSEAVLRREHSEGEAFITTPNSRVRPRGYQDELFSLGPPRNLLVHQDDTQDAARRLAAARRRGVAAEFIAGRKEVTEDFARRRSSSNLSSQASGTPRMDSPTPTSERPFLATPGSVVNPFPQRDLNRPLPRRPSREHLPDRRSREITLPRWQPDVEANECPICHTAFGFWFRKHHCRKCGRVVCANCSPHRITIPRQFIVHPPEDATPSPEVAGNVGPPIVDLTGDDETPRASSDNRERPQSADYRIDPALGGGQEVRLCNPCVPDPNPMPPPSYYSPSRSSSQYTILSQMPLSHGHPSQFDHGIPMNDPHSLLNRSQSGRTRYRSSNGYDIDARVRPPFPTATPLETGSSNRRHFHQPRQTVSPVNSPTAYGSAPDPIAQERFLEDLVQRRRSGHHPHHRQHASLGGSQTGHSRPYWSEELDLPGPRPVPQPQLREEDECPICHGALPPKEADGSETAREAHVSECIETHLSFSTPRAAQAHPSTATDAAVATATPSQAGAARGHQASGSSSQDRPSSVLFQQRRRTTGMVVYHATEKDCVGEDGEEAECVICFEEFSVGDEMGRLECLCKFHKVYRFLLCCPRLREMLTTRQACIRQWWDTKGPGACPVHQQQGEG